MKDKSQASLLTKKRFLPYFLTQAFGAFNDNVYKNILLILLAFAAPSALPVSSNLAINIAAGLFILPFFLFSASAGVLADVCDKGSIMRWVKLAEIIIMSIAAVAFYYQSYVWLLFLLFLMGIQSAFFGPAKYALLPQHLHKDELVSGNALVETGTFLAILLGTLVAGIIADEKQAHTIAGFFVVICGLIGFACSWFIPSAPPPKNHGKFTWRPVSHTKNTLKIAYENKTIFQCVLGISWFWFLGACYLTQFPNFAKLFLGGDATSVSFLLALFSIGIAIGSLLCDKLSNHRIEPGIIPLGSLGITLFSAGLWFFTPQHLAPTTSLMAFIEHPDLVPLFASLVLLGISGGIFIVPLYAIMQRQAKESERAQIIAANNIWNALFMVFSTIIAVVCLSLLHLNIPQFFLILAILNALVLVYIYKQIPDFFWRFTVWLFCKVLYRIQYKGMENIPEKGGVLLVCNHVTYMDALLLAGACPRPIRFLMDETIYNMPIINKFCKTCKVIPVKAGNRRSVQEAFNEVARYLDEGDVVCLFPEGQLTYDGEIAPFMRGVDLILRRNPVPVVPMALQGLWGSVLSRKGGKAFHRFPEKVWRKVGISASTPIQGNESNGELLREEVMALRGDQK